MRKIISVILMVCIAVSCLGLCASAAGGKKSYYVTCKTSADVMDFVLEGGKHAVPIRIVKAALTQGKSVRWVYLVGLVGVEAGTEQTNNIKSCMKAGFAQTSDYFDVAKDTIQKVVPKGANLVLAGHSAAAQGMHGIVVLAEALLEAPNLDEHVSGHCCAASFRACRPAS